MNDDIDKVKSVLSDILESDERILSDPKPRIAVSELADSSVNLIVRPWVKNSDYIDVLYSLTEEIKKNLTRKVSQFHIHKVTCISTITQSDCGISIYRKSDP